MCRGKGIENGHYYGSSVALMLFNATFFIFRKDITMDKIVKKIRELVIENAEIEDKSIEILSGKNLVEDLGYDSVGLINLICELEEEFDISFDGIDELIEKFNTYDSIVNLVIDILKGNKNETVR